MEKKVNIITGSYAGKIAIIINRTNDTLWVRLEESPNTQIFLSEDDVEPI